jgi:hypothetical protein
MTYDSTEGCQIVQRTLWHVWVFENKQLSGMRNNVAYYQKILLSHAGGVDVQERQVMYKVKSSPRKPVPSCALKSPSFDAFYLHFLKFPIPQLPTIRIQLLFFCTSLCGLINKSPSCQKLHHFDAFDSQTNSWHTQEIFKRTRNCCRIHQQSCAIHVRQEGSSRS